MHILFIEDNPAHAELLQENLHEASGFLVSLVWKQTLQAGLADMAATAFDLILLDLTLPDSVGLAGLEAIRKINAEVPVVVLTSQTDQRLGVEALRQGAQEYLIKGRLDLQVLMSALRFAVERSRLQKEMLHSREELRRNNVELEKLALTDPLTGIPNRRGLENLFLRESRKSMRASETFVIFLIDLDNFKRINDGFGHHVGDFVLKQVALRLGNALRDLDYVGRIGGDEFLVILPDSDLREGRFVAERIRLAIGGEPVTYESRRFTITCSIGGIQAPSGRLSFEEILAQSHQFLGSSKKAGKNRLTLEWEQVGQNRPHEELGAVIQALLSGDCFRVLHQPIRALRDQEIVGYELFTRSSIPGFELPRDIFRLSHESKILTSVDEKCLENVLRHCGFQERAHINLFPATLAKIPLSKLLGLLQDTFPKKNCCLELCHQFLADDGAAVVPAVQALRKEGFSVAMGNVGTGRTSLESMMLLNPEIVKIDRGLIHGIAQSQTQRETLERLLNFTAGLGAQVITEGIENQNDLQVLTDLGVAFGQGHYFGSPVALTPPPVTAESQ